jgi:hypothetical protein
MPGVNPNLHQLQSHHPCKGVMYSASLVLLLLLPLL